MKTHYSRYFSKRGCFRGKVCKLMLYGLALLYLFGPAIAGMLNVGNADGPLLYNRKYHSFLFRVGYGIYHDDKPRGGLCERRWFYGMETKLRTDVAASIGTNEFLCDNDENKMIETKDAWWHASLTDPIVINKTEWSKIINGTNVVEVRVEPLGLRIVLYREKNTE